MVEEEMIRQSVSANYSSMDPQIENQLKGTKESFLIVIEFYKKIYTKFNELFEEINFSKRKIELINDLNESVRTFANEVSEFLNVNSNIPYILNEIDSYNLKDRIDYIIRDISIYNNDKYSLVEYDISRLVHDNFEFLDKFSYWFNDYKKYIKVSREAEDKAQKLNLEIEKSKALLNTINSEKTEKIYSTASEKYLKYARVYDGFSYIVLLAILSIGIYIFINYPANNINLLSFFLPKFLILSTLVTLATIFLRKASHLRKLHDQANQTSLELQALPLYLRNVNESEHSEIYKNLAEKYFGKELDQTQNDKIGDLMQDQITSGTELIRASAEMLKAKNGAKDE